MTVTPPMICRGYCWRTTDHWALTSARSAENHTPTRMQQRGVCEHRRHLDRSAPRDSNLENRKPVRMARVAARRGVRARGRRHRAVCVLAPLAAWLVGLATLSFQKIFAARICLHAAPVCSVRKLRADAVTGLDSSCACARDEGAPGAAADGAAAAAPAADIGQPPAAADDEDEGVEDICGGERGGGKGRGVAKGEAGAEGRRIGGLFVCAMHCDGGSIRE